MDSDSQYEFSRPGGVPLSAAPFIYSYRRRPIELEPRTGPILEIIAVQN
jgi:hypothetical protein